MLTSFYAHWQAGAVSTFVYADWGASQGGRGHAVAAPAGAVPCRPALAVRDRRLPGACPGDLRAGPLGSVPVHTCGRGRVHRRGVLLHVLDQLCQPRDHRRPDVLRYFRRDRGGFGPGVHCRRGHRRSARRRSDQGALPGTHAGRGRTHTRPARRRRRHANQPGRVRRHSWPDRRARPVRQQPASLNGSHRMHLLMIGGSDAGISAALRARELDPSADVTVVVADAYPNFSICGIPYYVSGEVTHWRNLAHRTTADLEAAGLTLRLDTTARRIDVQGRKLFITTSDSAAKLISYDKLVIGTGAAPIRPPISR